MPNNPAHPRDRILALLGGERAAPAACFSGLVSVTQTGLDEAGLHFSEAHADPAKMAAAAASTYRQFGFESAVAPLDLCVEAEALGAQIDFRPGSARPEFPMVVKPLAENPDDFDPAVVKRLDGSGRAGVVREAIRLLHEQVGREIVVGAWVPGPFTLALQIVNMTALTAAVARDPAGVGRVMDPLVDLLAEQAAGYRAAGADMITVHEMGGSPGFIGPRAFEALVLPRLQRLLAAIDAPRVLSVCGNTNRAMPLLAEAGADAISVDQTNDLARSRATLGPEALLFGNIDPIGVLANGGPAEVAQAVQGALAAGVDAIWPGCDLWPAVPAENMRALVAAAKGQAPG
jgi:MtaA/CmuA family methyltransferase